MTTMQTGDLAVRLPRQRGSSAGRPAGAAPVSTPRVRWWRELLLLALVYVGYLAARAQIDMDPGAAAAAGRALLDIEGALMLDIERPANAMLHAVPLLAVAAAYVYATLHYVLTPAVLVWLALRHKAVYGLARNSLLIATALGLVGFALLPTAPPRLLDPSFVDTMAVYSDWGWWGSAASAPRGMEGLSNQYAAMPSLHVGWAVWVAMMVWRYSGSAAVRRWAWTYPALTTLVVVATANHYVLDAVAGAAVVVAGAALATRLQRRPSLRASALAVRTRARAARASAPAGRASTPAPARRELCACGNS
jgi:hypothetical protein